MHPLDDEEKKIMSDAFLLAKRIGKMLDPLKQEYSIFEISHGFAMFVAGWNNNQSEPLAVSDDWNKLVRIYMKVLRESPIFTTSIPAPPQ